MYYLNVIFVFFKIFLYQLEYYLRFTSYMNNIILLNILILFICIIRYIKTLPPKEPWLNQIMWFRFDYNFERYYSLFISFVTFIIYVVTILYLRFLSSSKTINLKEIKNTTWNLILDTPLLIFCTTIIILILLFYLVFILILGCIRNYIHTELVKLHFYYLDKIWYEKLHNNFNFKLSVNGLYNKIFGIYWYLSQYLALGYKINAKNKPFRLPTKEEEYLIEKHWFNKLVNLQYLTFALNNLHYIILIFMLSYDIIFNDYTIQYTLKVFPLLFLYQIYIALSTFIEEKNLIGICAYTNYYFYHKVVHLSENTIMIDGEISQLPFNFPETFMEYKASGFKKQF